MEEEIVLFEDNGLKLEVPVTPEQETVWLNRAQMAELFDRDVKTIGKHIVNARREELDGQVVVANFATTTQHGGYDWKNANTYDRILTVIEKYSEALQLLDAYDHQNMKCPIGNQATYVLTYKECRDVIGSMRFGNESDLFGKEKDDSIIGYISTVF
ncbi:MAG: hypothetical protein K2M91_02985 [Lachnospiraceae bacterium]|nr:hypothetical protein [Lachnospiraceae bacterium]